LWRCD